MNPINISGKQSLFERIVREEYSRVKSKLVNESKHSFSKTLSNIDPTYVSNTSQHHTWHSESSYAAGLQSKLKAMGAQPYHLGGNPDGMELIIYNKDNDPIDRLWFYSTGRVFVQDPGLTYDYKFDGNDKLIISDKGETVGTINLSGGKAIYTEDPKMILKSKTLAQQKIQAALDLKANKTIDKIQSWLDWAGVLPVVGDMVDAINALWYFSRGKWWDGILSSIAIVPGIGSGIAIGIRRATVNSSKTATFLKNLDDVPTPADKFKLIFEHLLAQNYLSTKQMAALKTELGDLADLASHSDSWVKKYFKNPEAQQDLINRLNGVDKLLKDAGMSLEKTLGSTGSDLAASVGKTIDATQSSVNIMQSPFGQIIQNMSNAPLMSLLKQQPEQMARLSNWLVPAGSMGLKPVRRIAKGIVDAPWFPARKVELLISSMEKGFRSRLDEPEYLIAVLKTMPGRNSIQKEIASQMGKQSEVFGKTVQQTRRAYRNQRTGQLINQQEFNRLRSRDRSNYSPYNETYDEVQSITDTQELLQNLKNSKNSSSNINVGEYKQIADQVAAYAYKESPIWGMYVSNIGNQWRHQYNLNSVSLLQNMYGTRFADVISSELEDTIEAVGFDAVPNDEHNGLLFNAIAEYLYEKFEKPITAVKSFTNSPMVQGLVRQAGDVVHNVNPFASARRYNPNAV